MNNFSLLSSPDGLRRILCNTVLESKDEDTDLLGRVLLADSTLWKGNVTCFCRVVKPTFMTLLLTA